MTWSYTRQVKGELAGTPLGAVPCSWAELWGLSGQVQDPFWTENPWVRTGAAFVVRRGYRLMKHVQLNPTVKLERQTRRVEFTLWGDDVPPPDIEQSLADCPQALLRGAFLARGYVSEIERPLHWEIQVDLLPVADILVEAMAQLDVVCHRALRRKRVILYIKDREQATYLLGAMGAHQSVLAMESQNVVREMKNQVNRLVNSETANMKRIVDSALNDAQAIGRVAHTNAWRELSPDLRQLADLRIKHPDWSFEEIGRHFRPPLSKSAVNHRLRRLRRWMQDQLENR